MFFLFSWLFLLNKNLKFGHGFKLWPTALLFDVHPNCSQRRYESTTFSSLSFKPQQTELRVSETFFDVCLPRILVENSSKFHIAINIQVSCFSFKSMTFLVLK